jgi:hypothetical protein
MCYIVRAEEMRLVEVTTIHSKLVYLDLQEDLGHVFLSHFPNSSETE